MDATNGVPGRPLHWLPLARILSLERTADSLAVQLKAFSVTQAVKALLSLKKEPQKDLWGIPRSGSLDALRELAKPLGGGAGFFGAMHLSGFHLASNGCQCESEGLCECNHSDGGCGCSDPDCECCVSEDDFEYEEHHVPELQQQWGFPSVVLNGGPNPYSPRCAPDAYFQVRRDSRSQRFASKKWADVPNFGWARPLERRAAFEEGEFAQNMRGSFGKVVEENVVAKDDAQDSKGVSEKSPSMWSAIVVRRRKDDAGQVATNRGRGEDLQSSKNLIQKKKAEDSSPRISEATEADSETQKNHAAQCPPPLTRLSLNWWPFGAQSAAAAVEPCSTAKWNFRMGQNAGAGALAGGVVSLCLHPIDTLKTIVQSQTGGSRNLLPILSSVISERGTQFLLRHFFRNLSYVH